MTLITNFEQYRELCTRTLPDLGNTNKNVLHMIIGLRTENGELLDIVKKNYAYGKEIDQVNLKEELGDIFWYAFNGVTLIIKDLEKVSPEDAERVKQLLETLYSPSFVGNHIVGNTDKTFEELYEEQRKVHDEAQEDVDFKDRLALNVYILCNNLEEVLNQDNALQIFLNTILATFTMVKELGYDSLEIMTKNINKLQQRFPDKFDAEKAVNRDLDKEREILES